MGKVWVLDTETKGTGAQMLPLEKVLSKPVSEPLHVPPKRTPRAPKPPEPKQPRRFKVVDVMTREVLAEDVGARATVELLRAVNSIVDVNIGVWEPKPGSWRLLTLRESRMLWDASRAPQSRRGDSNP